MYKETWNATHKLYRMVISDTFRKKMTPEEWCIIEEFFDCIRKESQRRDSTNERTWNYIKEKRKTNKNYCRSKKEKKNA